MKPYVSIVILNWNGWEDTIECLESLYQISYPNYDVIIVDNNSEDDSIEKIKEYCRGELKPVSKFFDYELNKKPIKVFEYFKDEIKDLKFFKNLNSNEKIIFIENDRNYGFSEGNNIGMRFVLKNFDSDYVLLLNNDTVVEKEFLNELINCAIKNPKGGIVGPKIRFYDKPNIINAAGGKIIWHLGAGCNIGMGQKDLGQFDEPFEYDYLMGACLLINRFLIRKIGLMNRKLFLLFEDVDFCIRAKKAGYKLLLNPKSVIYHKEGISGTRSLTYYYYMYRNRLLILRKHQKPIKIVIYGLYISIRTLIIIIYYTAKGDTKVSKSILKGYIQGIKS